MIGRRVMGRRVTAPSDRSEPIVARPQLTSKACGARLSVSGGGRHVARREDDKCASYGSLFMFIGQSSGDGSVGQGEGRCGPVRPARFVARYKCAHLMIFGRPQVGLDAAVSAGGRSGSDTSFVGASAPRKILGDFLYSRHFQLTLPVLSNRIRISNFYLLLEVPSGPPPRSLDSGRDSPASGALLLGDGEKRQR